MKIPLGHIVAGVLLIAPRTALGYVGYVLAPLLFVNLRLRGRQIAFIAALVVYGAVALGIQAMRQSVSPTSAVLELALLFPFLLFIAGVRPRGEVSHAIFLMRMVNVSLAIIASAGLLYKGIPYVTAIPDTWNALYGVGGAKILTVIAFFGIVLEFVLREHGHRMSRVALTAAIVNFILPSYLIGIAVGVIALALGLIRSWRAALPIVIVVVGITIVPALDRLGALNSTAIDLLGIHPKVFAYLASMDALTDGHLLGLGVGQFTSTPQTWLDPGLSANALNSVPSLPFFTMSDAYSARITEYTQIGSEKMWAFSSSLNQPVAGWAALLGEWGVGAIAIAVAIGVRLAGAVRSPSIRAAAIFFVIVNVVDSWFDTPWFGVVAILVFGISERLREGDPFPSRSDLLWLAKCRRIIGYRGPFRRRKRRRRKGRHAMNR